jgi:adenosylcobinamide-GDP ribazoletransferase
LAFLTVLGRPRRRAALPPTPAALVWFPVVGALVGAVVGLTWWGASNLWPLFVAATLALAVDLALTGMLHLDGLADSADGLLPHLDRHRRLGVMAAPDVGAFAIGVVVVTLLLRLGGIAALPSSGGAVAFVAGTWAASRSLMATAATSLPAARPNGLGRAFASGATTGQRAAVVVLGVALGLGGVVLGRGLVGALALFAGLLAGGAVAALARQRLGGFTGDVLGAIGMVTETVALLVAAARW